jgi:SAM-dependent methyltransferase
MQWQLRPKVTPLTDFDLDPWLPHGEALRSYFEGNTDASILVHDDHGDVDELPVSYFFREPEDFPEIELKALSLCRGRVLDVGAGAGCHSLFLQEQGFEVVPIEVLPELVDVLTGRGLANARQAEVFDLDGEKFDTVLLLMNGVGLAGTVEGLQGFLLQVQSLVVDGGQILADSTDLRGLVGLPEGSTTREDGRYIGEVTFQLEFAGRKGPPFPQLYADPDLLVSVVEEGGWRCEISLRNENGGYLAQIVR